MDAIFKFTVFNTCAYIVSSAIGCALAMHILAWTFVVFYACACGVAIKRLE